ncbi:MAG: serine/threonine-protein kinase [Rubricoccaceae bacterium]|nr:serine/threonine-protein kinase [Rubricoccaceae bacterium]
MNTALWERVEALFSEAVEQPPDARAAFLDRACGGEARLRAEVEGLLAADEADRALGVEHRLLPDEDEAREHAPTGQRVGPYRIEGELGRGGMGVVYRARRADGAFEKTVALKLVKRGMDTDEVLARFRRERQVLAGLDHPGIARLLDAGEAADGRPYLAMEYVEGEPVTAYADRRRLGVEARLHLFEAVCEAVAYAHQRFIVHRDLKPSNILVAEDDAGRPQVKLLDFGISKLLDPEASGLSVLATRTDARMLTPAYAAPEQVRGEPVTAATDVYALGELLYELLTGRRAHALNGRTPSEREQAIVEEETPRPSRAIQADAAEVASVRSTPPRRLQRRLRGDLDAICGKALRKAPEQRYASVEALKTDVQRHRDGLPIEARPETAGYRLRTFVRRHRVGVAAAALVALSLVGGLSVALWQARAAAEERDAARREADKAQQVTDFLVQVFEEADPRESGGRTRTAQEILNLGAARIESELSGQPEVQAELLGVVGRVYRSMGLYDEALPFLNQALALRRSRLGSRHPDVAASLSDKANLLRDRGDFAGAEALYREALAIGRGHYGDEHPHVAATLDELALNLHYAGRRDESVALHHEALALRRRLLGPDHLDVAASLNNLAGALDNQADAEEAEALYREALAIRRRLLGPTHPDIAVTLNNVAVILRQRGDLAGAEPLYREALDIWRAHYGDAHPHVASGLNNLAALLRTRGDLDAAEALYREALAIRRRAHGAQHPDVAVSLNNLGKLLYTRREYAAAEPLYREAIAMWQALYGEAYPHLSTGLRNLADVRLAIGDSGGAEALYRRAVAQYRATWPAGHPKTGEALVALGRCLLTRGQAAEAESVLEEGHRLLQAALGADDPATQDARAALGEARATRH